MAGAPMLVAVTVAAVEPAVENDAAVIPAPVDRPFVPATTPAALSVPVAVTCATDAIPAVERPAAVTVPAAIKPDVPITADEALNADDTVS